MFAPAPQPEILDLRHFSGGALRPLLAQEAAAWEKRLFWDYNRSIELLLEYIDNRSLSGYVALRKGRVAGYAFGVCEAAKAVIGDVYAFGEGERAENPTCDLLLEHLLETLQATPGIDRVESQLLLFPHNALARPFRARGLRAFPRQFMLCRLAEFGGRPIPLHAPHPERWRPEVYLHVAGLIHEAYEGHMDSQINDQYQSLAGAQRFLHNIVHFPGCGVFEPNQSWFLRDPGTGEIQGVVLCSRVRADAAHITQLCVRKRLRGQGIGNLLLAQCLAGLRNAGFSTVSLTVTEDNIGARRLYEREGFQTLHRFEAWVG